MSDKNKKIVFSPLPLILFVFVLFYSCKKADFKRAKTKNTIESKLPYGMIWVESNTFLQGAKDSDNFAMPREKPVHDVMVDGFYIDITEVTNKQYNEFVAATEYITVAERNID
ncbi:hypothetical protein PI23P_02272 [Polaribacter irgensii 23-P]|uniref:Sulfatase-modifying factor enzyme-like domain-containing protein n=1 Tax=Polaribacter irgensii 23-P TaxID=313594 RepID=A4BWE1_9FLAO|nr:hypothetical protein PI23P_02272 [Polaribacter irgensii 23-P]